MGVLAKNVQMKKFICRHVLFICILPLMYFSSIQENIIVDELDHIVASYDYVTHFTYRFNIFHPPLIKDLAGIGMLIGKIPDPKCIGDYKNTLDCGFRTMNITNNPDEVLWYARTPVLLFNLLLLYFLSHLVMKRFGEHVAFLSTAFIGFSPSFLANGRYVTFDVPIALLSTVFIFLFDSYLSSLSLKSFVLVLIALTAALLTKGSALLLIPASLLIFITHSYNHKLTIQKTGSIFLLYVAAFVFVSLTYSIHIMNMPLSENQEYITYLKDFGFKKQFNLLNFFINTPLLRPLGCFFTGIIFQSIHIFKGTFAISYFNGEIYQYGKMLFYPVLLFVKETPIFILSMFGLVFFSIFQLSKIRKFDIKAHNFYLILYLNIFSAAYFIICILSNLNLGNRYLLSFIVPISILISVVISKSKLSYLLVLFHILLSINSYPYFLSYYNIFSNKPGELIALDSNFDWGQDLKRLGIKLKELKYNTVYLDYAGRADPNYYLAEINFTNWKIIDPLPPGGSILAMSKSNYVLYMASKVIGGYPQFQTTLESRKKLKFLKKIDEAGSTIIIFEVQNTEVKELYK